MKRFATTLALLAIVIPTAAVGQARTELWNTDGISSPLARDASPASVSDEVAVSVRRLGVGIHPLLRTAAMIAASTGGYYLAYENTEETENDVEYVPISAGAGASALTGILLSSGNPFRIIIGSALSTLPAAALSTFVGGVLEEDADEHIPTYLFGVTHGLLSSAFAQNR